MAPFSPQAAGNALFLKTGTTRAGTKCIGLVSRDQQHSGTVARFVSYQPCNITLALLRGGLSQLLPACRRLVIDSTLWQGSEKMDMRSQGSLAD